MLNNIQISNFKSILNDKISLGRINVFIGENGSGKSNILEALMFAKVAETYTTIDADILYTNGIRVSKPSLLLSSFKGKRQSDKVVIDLDFNNFNIHCELIPENKDNILSKWKKIVPDVLDIEYQIKNYIESIIKVNKKKINKLPINEEKPQEKELIDYLQSEKYNKILFSKLSEKMITEIYGHNLLKNSQKETADYISLNDFIIYTLNTEALRGIPEFHNSRKGIYGETLDIIISELTDEERIELNEYLYTITWLQEFFIDEKDELKQKGYKLNYSKSLLYFKDKYMSRQNNVFSSENSNEGILHILFYLANIISSKTPQLFAIDNIETSLNPHLCQHLMSEICKLSKKHNKQILITTHNPAILDGLNLFDDEIRLFEVKRTDNGDTKTRRIALKPEVKNSDYKLSDLWTRGFLGAISENF